MRDGRSLCKGLLGNRYSGLGLYVSRIELMLMRAIVRFSTEAICSDSRIGQNRPANVPRDAQEKGFRASLYHNLSFLSILNYAESYVFVNEMK
jgi:hypothetical protein